MPSAETFYKLPSRQAKEFLEAYFGKNLQYNLIRTSMNSSDFSSGSYTYVEENDKALKTFNIQHDEQYKIPMIKGSKNDWQNFKFYFSPWSPPAWMKDNNNMLRGGETEKEYYQPWANYYVKFIKEYEKEEFQFGDFLYKTNLWLLRLGNLVSIPPKKKQNF